MIALSGQKQCNVAWIARSIFDTEEKFELNSENFNNKSRWRGILIPEQASLSHTENLLTDI